MRGLARLVGSIDKAHNLRERQQLSGTIAPTDETVNHFATKFSPIQLERGKDFCRLLFLIETLSNENQYIFCGQKILSLEYKGIAIAYVNMIAYLNKWHF